MGILALLSVLHFFLEIVFWFISLIRDWISCDFFNIFYFLNACLSEVFCIRYIIESFVTSGLQFYTSGAVIEIPGDMSIVDAVRILSEHHIMTAPVTHPNGENSIDWRERYLGIIDYAAIILWVLENAELAAITLSASSATATGVGAGAVGALGAAVLGATGPAAVAGLTIAAVGAAIAGGVATEKGMGKDAPSSVNHLGEAFYKTLLEEEPFKSTTVSIIYFFIALAVSKWSAKYFCGCLLPFFFLCKFFLMVSLSFCSKEETLNYFYCVFGN